MRKSLMHRLLLIVFFATSAAASTVQRLGDEYLDRYFLTFPSRATMAGRRDLSHELESLDARARAAWLAYSRTMRDRVVAARPADIDDVVADTIDHKLLLRAIDREIYHLGTLRVPE